MDPTPFRNRDLDTDAEEFLETWAMGFPQETHFRIIIHIEEMPAEDPQPLVADAIHNYFAYKALLSKRMLRSLMLEGRTSLLIGLGFLFCCLVSADALSAFEGNAFLRVLKEGLIIGGWVAMWRPMQVFLYEWWPLARRGRIFSNLSTAKIHVVPGNGGGTDQPAV